LIGNPTRNPNIKDLYKQVITGKEKEENLQPTSIEVEQERIQIPSLKIGETTEVSFIIKNTGQRDLHISDVMSSCDCALPSWKHQLTPPGESAEIKVRIKPDSAGDFEWEIEVFCNIDRSNIKFIIEGTVME